jgi:hypothetical protein
MVKWADIRYDVSILLPPVAPGEQCGDGPGPAVASAGPCHFLAPIPLRNPWGLPDVQIAGGGPRGARWQPSFSSPPSLGDSLALGLCFML